MSSHLVVRSGTGPCSCRWQEVSRPLLCMIKCSWRRLLPFPHAWESALCSSSCAGAESARAAAAGADSQWQGAIAQGSTQFVSGFTNPPRPSAGVEDVQAAAAGASLPWQAPTALRAHTVHARAKVASRFPDAGAEGVRVAAAGAGPSWQAPRARRR